MCPQSPCPLCDSDLDKAWYTLDACVAYQLREFADADLQAHLDAEATRREHLYEKVYLESTASDSRIEIPVPDGLSYLPFQRAGIAFAANRLGTLIADEMGLGKTVQSVGVINLTNPQQVLVVCPASLKINWKQELNRWLVTDHSCGIADASFPGTDIVVLVQRELEFPA